MAQVSLPKRGTEVSPKMVYMTLKKAEADFPALVPATGCVRPFMKLFSDARRISVSKTGAYLEVSSDVLSPDLDETVKEWTAIVSANGAEITGYEDKGWALVSQLPSKRKKLSLGEFSDFLARVDGKQKSVAGTAKRQSTADTKQRKASKKSTPQAKKGGPRRSRLDDRLG